MRLNTALGILATGISAIGCAGNGAAVSATSPSASSIDKESESREKAEPKEENEGPSASVLYAAHEAVPALPDECQRGTSLPKQAACNEARPELAIALGLEAAARDVGLAKLEACSEFAPGLIRALRADLGKAECADALVVDLVGPDTEDDTIPTDVREALVALGLGARLRRLASDPPEAPSERTSEALGPYFQEVIFPWISAQAQAIFVMARQGVELSGYARGIVAIEAGNADMRFVEIVRDAPIADKIAAHEEAKDVYYATLDERLEGRKSRGRNAALVGLREMARLGVRNSERVDSARRLLSKVYGGRRVNALDTLMVPLTPPQKAESDAAAIASRVPSSFASSLLGHQKVSPNLTRAHLQMGMPVGMRRQIEVSSDAASKLLLARALFESGRTYFRSEDFQAALALLTPIVDDKKSSSQLTSLQLQRAVLLRALSVALLAGPKDAAELIAKGPRFADALGNLVILDGLASKKGELGGRAAFNSAYLRELIAPTGDPTFWKDLSAQYLSASRKLKGSERKIASERSRACTDIQRALIADQRAAKRAK